MCEVAVYKRSFGILLNGEFVLFLSSTYVMDKFHVTLDDIDRAESTIDLSVDSIRLLVKKEKTTRVKLNKL